MVLKNYISEPDEFFAETQIQRLSELNNRRQLALGVGSDLPAEEQAELEYLVNAELEASARRAEAIFRQRGGNQE